MTARNQTIMNMYYAGYTSREIAKKVGITRNVVAGVVHRNRITEPDPVKAAARRKVIA